MGLAPLTSLATGAVAPVAIRAVTELSKTFPAVLQQLATAGAETLGVAETTASSESVPLSARGQQVRRETLQRQAETVLKELTEQLRGAFHKAGVQTSEPLELASTRRGILEERSGNPQRSEIEEALADPQIQQQFQRLHGLLAELADRPAESLDLRLHHRGGQWSVEQR